MNDLRGVNPLRRGAWPSRVARQTRAYTSFHTPGIGTG